MSWNVCPELKPAEPGDDRFDVFAEQDQGADKVDDDDFDDDDFDDDFDYDFEEELDDEFDLEDDEFGDFGEKKESTDDGFQED